MSDDGEPERQEEASEPAVDGALSGRDAGADVIAGHGVDEELKWPVGFMVLLALTALYLAWRLVQLVAMALEWVN